jgi:uncharacterized protein YjeT (DUF2065 family)
MELSVLIARIAAVVYVTTGAAMLVGTFDLKAAYAQMKKDPMFMPLLGTFVSVLGMLIASYHNVWVKGWPVLITIIGWVLLLEGVFYILFPRQLLAFFKKLPTNQIGWGIFTMAMGCLFGYFGFI